MTADDARRRFEDATRTHLIAPLPHGVEVRTCSTDEWRGITDTWWALQPRPDLDLAPLYSEAERERIADLDALLAAPLEHRVVLHAAGTPIGAYWGHQEEFGRYYMVNTILHPTGAAGACTARCSPGSRQPWRERVPRDVQPASRRQQRGARPQAARRLGHRRVRGRAPVRAARPTSAAISTMDSRARSATGSTVATPPRCGPPV